MSWHPAHCNKYIQFFVSQDILDFIQKLYLVLAKWKSLIIISQILQRGLEHLESPLVIGSSKCSPLVKMFSSRQNVL